jgi:hypothetical protein
VPSVAIAYELYLPLAAAGFGLSSRIQNLWPDGLVIFTVYLAWAQGTSPADYTIHLRRSTDRGVTWNPGAECVRECEAAREECENEHGRGARRCSDGFRRCSTRCGQAALRSISGATIRPAAAADGTVGFVYQRLTGTAPDLGAPELSGRPPPRPPTSCWPGRRTWRVLAWGIPGRLSHLMAVQTPYGVFSVDNRPDQPLPRASPLRSTDFANRTLLTPTTGARSIALRPYFLGGAPPRLTVRKVVVLAGDPGRFNLQVDGMTVAANAGNGGT